MYSLICTECWLEPLPPTAIGALLNSRLFSGHRHLRELQRIGSKQAVWAMDVPLSIS